MYSFDDWNMIYSEELWRLWCIISEFNYNIFDKLTFPSFCDVCYQNSSKY